jgi:hypothetical protein
LAEKKLLHYKNILLGVTPMKNRGQAFRYNLFCGRPELLRTGEAKNHKKDLNFKYPKTFQPL